MHEWALAEGVILAIDRMAEEEGLKQVIEASVKIGELQQVDYEILKFALGELRTSKMGKLKFILETIPAVLKCRICDKKWKFNSKDLGEEKTEAIHFLPEIAHVYVRCPKCGSPDFEIAEGRGVWLKSIRGRKEDD
jgi:hydrogenase nickel incorporation protein HypA/HybF